MNQISIKKISILILFLVEASVFSQEISNKDIYSMVSKINTNVDSNFVYEYEQTKFVPPNGKTILIMGQTVEGINEYLDHFSDQPLPGGWATYFGVTEFKGVTETYKNETGSSQNHQLLVDKFPNAVIQSAMWMVGKWNIPSYTVQGYYDKVLKKYAKWAKSVNRPIYLRIGYEFDGVHNELNPDEYVEAYKYIVNFFRKQKVENIAYVWHSYASEPYKSHPVSDWYPGDAYVDWVGVSVFGHAYNKDFGVYCNKVLDFAKTHKKPVMIAESSPIQGIPTENPEVWDDWFVNFFSFIYNKNIKAVSFINENWQDLNIPGIGEWKDARLSNNQNVAKAWFKEVGKDKYLKQSEDLYIALGYSN
jgi:hypothetical protein